MSFQFFRLSVIFGVFSFSEACIHVTEEKLKEQQLFKEKIAKKERILSANFSSDGKCITRAENFKLVKEELKELIQLYPHDLDLLAKYKTFLFRKAMTFRLVNKLPDSFIDEDRWEGMEVWAKLILFNEDSYGEYVFNFLKELSQLEFLIEGISVKFPLVNACVLFDDYQTITKKNKKHLIETVKFTFSFFKDKKYIYDALIYIFSRVNEANSKYVVKDLYDLKIHQSSYFNLYYSIEYLFSNANYKEIIKNLTPLLNDHLEDILYNYKNIRDYYQLLGISHISMGNLDEGQQYCEQVLEYEEDFKSVMMLAFIAVKQKSYFDAAIWLGRAQNFSLQEINKGKLNIDWIRKSYINCLQISGQEEKATEALLAYQNEMLSKPKEIKKKRKGLSPEIIKLIKEGQEALRRSQLIEEEKIAPKKVEKRKQRVSDDRKSENEYVYPQKEGKYISPVIKEKKKTRGEPSVQPVVIREEIPELGNERPKIEEILPSGHYKIFCKFFDKFVLNTKDKHVSILLRDFETLCSSWGQDLNRSKGKGSHSKLSFVPSSIEGMRDEMEKEVFTLSNKTHLLAYQIKGIRKMFMKYGYYPCYLKEKLSEKGLIN